MSPLGWFRGAVGTTAEVDTRLTLKTFPLTISKTHISEDQTC